MSLKGAARGVLHYMGGLAALRLVRRGQFRVLMFHEFHERHRADMERMCEHICAHFEPVTLTRVEQALRGEVSLPANALALTIDDGYFNVLEHRHPVLRKYRIPATVYAVAGFSNGELWLWTDQVAFIVEHTARKSIRVETIAGELDISSESSQAEAVQRLWSLLKEVPDNRRGTMIEVLRLNAAWKCLRRHRQSGAL